MPPYSHFVAGKLNLGKRRTRIRALKNNRLPYRDRPGIANASKDALSQGTGESRPTSRSEGVHVRPDSRRWSQSSRTCNQSARNPLPGGRVGAPLAPKQLNGRGHVLQNSLHTPPRTSSSCPSWRCSCSSPSSCPRGHAHDAPKTERVAGAAALPLEVEVVSPARKEAAMDDGNDRTPAPHQIADGSSTSTMGSGLRQRASALRGLCRFGAMVRGTLLVGVPNPRSRRPASRGCREADRRGAAHGGRARRTRHPLGRQRRCGRSIRGGRDGRGAGCRVARTRRAYRRPGPLRHVLVRPATGPMGVARNGPNLTDNAWIPRRRARRGMPPPDHKRSP